MKMTVIIHNEPRKIIKFKKAILIYTPGSYWYISPRNFQDGEINSSSIEIKRVSIKNFFWILSKFTQLMALLDYAENFVEICKLHAWAK